MSYQLITTLNPRCLLTLRVVFLPSVTHNEYAAPLCPCLSYYSNHTQGPQRYAAKLAVEYIQGFYRQQREKLRNAVQAYDVVTIIGYITISRLSFWFCPPRLW